MSKAWTDIPTTEIDTESPVTEGLLEKIYDNGECLISQPVDTRFAEIAAAASATIAALEIYIPPQVATAGGDVTFVIRFEAKVASGTGEVEARLGALTFVSSGTFTNTSYGFKTITISSADVKAAPDSAVTLTIRTKAGSATVTARCISASSRLERAA